jgi:hypothetical protein
VNEKNTAPIPINYQSDLPAIAEGIEPLYTVAEVAALLRWSYDGARRYFKDIPGVLVKYQPRRYKRAYRQYMVPKSVLQREWQRMAAFNSQRMERRAA